jgi:SAM-dependent methyltransferase
MDPTEYRILYEAESDYWWFHGLRGFLFDALRDAGIGAGSRILDAGCGTGGTLEAVGRELTPRAAGFDVSPHAAAFWPRRSLRRVCLASTNEIPFRSGTFDAVLSLDVLECAAVDPPRAYAELWRVARPGGVIVLWVPAYAVLTAEAHQRAVRAPRRWDRASLRTLARERPVRIERLAPCFALPFPAVLAFRVAARCLGGRPARARSELGGLPAPVNRALAGLTRLERRLFRRASPPFGSSLLAVLRKSPYN